MRGMREGPVRPLLPLLLLVGTLAATGPRRAVAAPAPGLVVEGAERQDDGLYVHAFGSAAQEQELRAHFVLGNAGDAPIEGLRAVGDCGCYGVQLSASSIAPSETATADVKFRTLMMSGRVTKRLRLYADGTAGPLATIRLVVDIVAGVVVEPHRFFFENVLVGSKPRATVVAKWRVGIGRPFEVTGVEVPDYDMRIEKKPYEEDGWKGTAITLAFETPPPLGVLSGTVLIRTDNPDYPRILLALTANVTGRVQVQSRIAYLGWVPRGTTRTARILVRPYDESVDLGTVTATSRRGRVEVAVRPAPQGPDEGWQVEISVPADAAPGPLDDVVEVHTKVQGEEVTEIEVRGEVIDREE